jgi:hypothetical protein
MAVAPRLVTFPNVAVVYEGMTGRLRRKIVPGKGETAQFLVEAGEGAVILHGPPFDDATCRTAVSAITGRLRQ